MMSGTAERTAQHGLLGTGKERGLLLGNNVGGFGEQRWRCAEGANCPAHVMQLAEVDREGAMLQRTPCGELGHVHNILGYSLTMINGGPVSNRPSRNGVSQNGMDFGQSGRLGNGRLAQTGSSNAIFYTNSPHRVCRAHRSRTQLAHAFAGCDRQQLLSDA
jgi:hypothetical protein